MALTLKKIFHRDAYRIGVFFPYSPSVNDKIKSLGATDSKQINVGISIIQPKNISY